MENLNYWGQGKDVETNNDTLDGSDKSSRSKGCHRTLCPIDELFLVMIQLHLGLGEGFGIQIWDITINCIKNINYLDFLYLQFHFGHLKK